jgi:hypothetical protein
MHLKNIVQKTLLKEGTKCQPNPDVMSGISMFHSFLPVKHLLSIKKKISSA